MLLVGAVDIALGWAWHTAHGPGSIGASSAKVHSLRRPWWLSSAPWKLYGPFIMAPSASGASIDAKPAPLAAATPPAADSAPAMTADATMPATAEPRPMEISPAAEPVQTVAAAASPEPVEQPDPIGAKIMERLGDDVATGSVDDATRVVAASPAKPGKPKPAKPAKRKVSPSAD